MKALTHLLFSFFLYFIALKAFHLSFSPLFLALVLFSSLLPDIDSANSFINRKLKVTKAVAVFAKHRGFWHSIFGLLLILFLLFLLSTFLTIPASVFLALSFGYLSHLLSDSLTVTGIKWFWKKGKVRGVIRTGSFSEKVFFMMLLLALIIVVSLSYKKEIKAFTAFFLKLFK